MTANERKDVQEPPHSWGPRRPFCGAGEGGAFKPAAFFLLSSSAPGPWSGAFFGILCKDGEGERREQGNFHILHPHQPHPHPRGPWHFPCPSLLPGSPRPQLKCQRLQEEAVLAACHPVLLSSQRLYRELTSLTCPRTPLPICHPSPSRHGPCPGGSLGSPSTSTGCYLVGAQYVFV